ncbi:MAG TPA: lysine 2,3-aminomutase, partial [Hydrogenothermaceae bacterium]|nr:lysine 2,3-aminomutase [Hydrogenothermaceae bacterium]
MKYKSYTAKTYKEIPQVQKALTAEQMFDIDVVSKVFPFKVNNYVINELIDWENPLEDPIFRLTFPQRGMLLDEDYETIAKLIKEGASEEKIK